MCRRTVHSPCVCALQSLERTAEAGAAIDQYEIEGPDRPELLMDLAEFQLAAVSSKAAALSSPLLLCVHMCFLL